MLQPSDARLALSSFLPVQDAKLLDWGCFSCPQPDLISSCSSVFSTATVPLPVTLGHSVSPLLSSPAPGGACGPQLGKPRPLISLLPSTVAHAAPASPAPHPPLKQLALPPPPGSELKAGGTVFLLFLVLLPKASAASLRDLGSRSLQRPLRQLTVRAGRPPYVPRGAQRKEGAPVTHPTGNKPVRPCARGLATECLELLKL